MSAAGAAAGLSTLPKVLIATTTWWPSAARLAIAFHQHGALVSAICPHGHPMRVLRNLAMIATYSAVAPLDALRGAIRSARPDIILPTDDRVVADLHALHAAATADAEGRDLRAVIERSLGASEGYALSGTRDLLLRMAQTDGIRVPTGRNIGSLADLHDWFLLMPGRCVLKAEGSWGGSGVSLVETEQQAEAAFLRMSRPLTFQRAFRILLFDRDPFPFVQFLRRRRQSITVQSFIHGRQANIMVACVNGRVVDTISADVLRAQNGTGAATVVRIVDCPEMEQAASVIACRIGASGFFGLDFMVEDVTGHYYLIEMNPRATQLGHLSRQGRTLAGSLLGALRGLSNATVGRAEEPQVVALFPQALRFEADWLENNCAWIDAPKEEPQLVAELLRRPWTKRSMLSRIEALLRTNDAYGDVQSPKRAAMLLDRLSQPKTKRADRASDESATPTVSA